MGKLIQQLLCVSALAFLGLTLGAQPALASDVDCPALSCTFLTTSPIITMAPALIGPGVTIWQGNFSENVYQEVNKYTYLFNLTLTAGSGTDSISSMSTGAGPPLKDLFEMGLNWGVVKAGSTGDISNTTSGVDDNESPGFNFNGATLQTNLTGMSTKAGNTYEFYAQSFAPPGMGTFGIFDGTGTSTDSLDPTPEPGSILLFGTGLLMLGLILRRRLPQLPQPR